MRRLRGHANDAFRSSETLLGSRVPLASLIQTLAVAEYLNFRHAAKALGVAQSSVSARVKALEEDLGILLFERHARGVRLTEAGRHFIQRVAAGVDQLDHAVKTAGMAAAGKWGLSAIGIDKEPEWPGFDDNFAGYDVLSYDHGASGLQNRMIEVKSTSVSPIQFYLSRNEWNQAEKKGDAYIFHVWDMKSDPPALHVRTVAEVAPHIPSDNGKGKWSNVIVPIGGG